ncbi:hypothetical protein VTK56DRAFT_2194 [Thermocarpiscus australiensis]
MVHYKRTDEYRWYASLRSRPAGLPPFEAPEPRTTPQFCVLRQPFGSRGTLRKHIARHERNGKKMVGIHAKRTNNASKLASKLSISI